MDRIRISAVVALCCMGVSPAANAQTLLYTQPDFDPGHFGNAQFIGDLEGDGHDDYIIGASETGPGFADHGSAYVFSGIDGSLKYTYSGGGTDSLGKTVGAAGDVDGDGFDDFAIASPGHIGMLPPPFGASAQVGMVQVFSGATGALIRTMSGAAELVRFGLAFAGGTDLNGDGFPDLIVVERSGVSYREPKITAFSGLDGSVLYSTTGPLLWSSVGSARLARAGDVNGDGVEDFILGSAVGLDAGNGIPPGLPGNTSPPGLALVYSGADGVLLHALVGDSPNDNFGRSVSGAGDVNGDGTADVIVGAPYADPIGTATVYSGADWSVLHSLEGILTQGNQSDNFGWSVAGLGDVNSDGVVDLLVGAPQADGNGSLAGRVDVISGLDGSRIYSVHAPESSFKLGTRVVGGGDVNGDGLPDFIISNHTEVGLPRQFPFNATAFVYAGTFVPPAPFLDFCSGDGGDQSGCTDCPCMNNAAPGTIGGCLNSTMTSSRLHATGSRSVSLTPNARIDLGFTLSGAPPGAHARLWSGNGVAPGNPANPCFGGDSGVQSQFFDGLRCAIGSTFRHSSRTVDSNGEAGANQHPWGGDHLCFQSPYPDCGGDISAQGGFVAGQTRYFQVIHRDDPLLSCGRGLNTSQAIEVTFEP